MKECKHKKISKKSITEKHFGLDFTVQTPICDDCDAVLWSPDVDEKFTRWMSDVASSNRDNLTLQLHFSGHTNDCLNNLVKRFPGTQLSSLIRAIVSVFINVVLADSEVAQKIENVTSGKIFNSFNHDSDKKKYNIFFKPTALLDIETWAKHSDLSPAKFVEEAVLRILALCYETEKELKEFWLAQIYPRLEMIMKAS